MSEITASSPGVPIGAPPSWLVAANVQGGQCGAWTAARGKDSKPVRCTHTLGGGYKLFMWEGVLLCAQHWDKARAEERKRIREQAAGHKAYRAGRDGAR